MVLSKSSAGFNHGFNICEAVNVCLPDWLSHGLTCVEHYRELHRMPVFSHDELLMTLFTNEKNPRSSRWLYPFFKEMIDREMADRKSARKSLGDLTEVVDDSDLAEEQFQCTVCKSYCYLSQVVSTSLPDQAACHEHANKVFGESEKTLRLRYPDEVLRQFLTRVKARSDKMGRQSLIMAEDGEARKSGRVVSDSAHGNYALLTHHVTSAYRLSQHLKPQARRSFLWLNEN